MSTRMGAFFLGILLAGSLSGFPGPSIAQQCITPGVAEKLQPRCFAQFGRRGIVDTTIDGDSSAVAVHSGSPKNLEACNGSLRIGDNVGWYGSNGRPGTITDINVIAQVSDKPSVFDHRVRDTVTAGWLYLDERGNFWVQMNRRELSQISAGTRAFFASVGLPDTTDGVATTGHHSPKVRSAHLRLQRCWSGGKDFSSVG